MCNAHSLINIAEIQAGSAINIIPEHAHVRIGIRPMPDHSEKDIIEGFEDRIDTLQKEVSKCSNYNDCSTKCTSNDHTKK